MQYVRVRVAAASGEPMSDRTMADVVDRITDLLWSVGVSGIEERSERDAVVLVSDPDTSSEEGASVVARIESIPGVSVEVGDADPAGWCCEWRRHARPTVIADRLVVRPPWVDSPQPELPEIRIDPGEAWGHGAHVTTRLALEMVISAPLSGRSVLDVGCGSGVLAIAAASLGAHPVLGIDVDPAAMEATRANAAENRVHVALVNGPLDAAGSFVAGGFDVVVANIEASVLRGLAADMSSLVAPAGRLVLSGMLIEQVESVIVGLHSDRDWTLVRRLDAEGWSAAELVPHR